MIPHMPEFHPLDLWNYIVRAIYAVFLWFGFVLGLFLVTHPSTNVAIGYLAGAAFLVSLRDEHVTYKHRALWAVMTIVLCVAEYRAIDKDRTENFEVHIHELSIQREAQSQILRSILETSNHQTAQNQSQFEKTVADMKDLAKASQEAIRLSNEAIGQVTGGDSWVDIGPVNLGGDPLSHLAITAHGRYPFYGESIEVYDSSGLHFRRPTYPSPAAASLIAVAQLGTVYPNVAHPLSFSVPVTNEPTQIFEFRVFGRTGITQETMKLYRSSSGTWLTAGETHRGKTMLGHWKDPGFPDDWKLETPTQPLDPKLSPIPIY
jgi:hypothetical protein